MIEGDDTGHHDVCDNVGLKADYDNDAGYDPHNWGRVSLYHDLLTILSVLMMELNFGIIARRPAIFFRQFSFLLDYIIMFVSLALEILFHTL